MRTRNKFMIATLALGLGACARFQEPQEAPNTDLSELIPEELSEALGTALQDAEYKTILTGTFADIASPEGFIRITDINCDAVKEVLDSPEMDDAEFRNFLETLVVDGNAEAGTTPRIIAACSGESFDADLS